MEMESIQLDHDCNSIKEISSLPDSPDINDVFGDPLVNARVGNEFQVEIPPMITESEHFWLLMNPADSEVMGDVSHSFLMGLPIPVMWVHVEVNAIEDDRWGFLSNHDNAVNAHVKSRNSKKSCSNVKKKGSKPNVETLDVELDQRKQSRSASLKPKVAGKVSLGQPCEGKSFSPVPGSLGDSWSDAEVDSFVLGLYIFGKNFIRVKRFIENKKMEEMLSFYYGKFYRSDDHRRWSDCRKKRSRKRVNGPKIFTGWRLQELLSRLLPHVPEGFKNEFLQVSKTFAEGDNSLEEYVSFLKTTVGIHVLVEAVGIGKGKEDLTGLAIEPVKNNQVFPVCPEIPTGKACSSLTSSNIIKFLSGGYRLSKARCNDIFWEAVWPRLLARGWHSEQPNNQGYVNSKHYLVFLMPGVEKFSRRKLVKGEHYFDSVSDVLSKVVLEPKLLELEIEEGKNMWVQEENSDQDDLSDHQSYCYLKPLVSTCSPNLMKFTVVDTSLVHERKSSTVRELRHSPANFRTTSKLMSLLTENDGNFFEDSLDKYKLDATEMPLNGEKKIDNANHSKGIFYSDGPNRMKYTVVDTSLVHGEKSSELRELRFLPVDCTSELPSLSRENEGNYSDDSLVLREPVVADIPSNGENNIDNANHSKGIIEDGGSTEKATNNSATGNKMVESHRDQKINTYDDKQSKRIIKHQFSRRLKSGHPNYLTPLIKRRRLAACAKAETSHIIENFSIGLVSKQVESCCTLNSSDASKNVDSQVFSKEKVSSISSSKSSPEDKNGGAIVSGSGFGMDMSDLINEKHPSRPLVELNLPQNRLDSGNCVSLMMEVEQSQSDTNADGSSFTCMTNKLVKNSDTLETSADVGTAEQQPNLNTRRQSTRNRSLTTRALEALGSEFFNMKRGRKSKVLMQEEN